jgi:hypothetical protein
MSYRLIELRLNADVDNTGVDRFAEAMKEKLRFCREVKQRGGWHIPHEVPLDRLKMLLKEHLEKGDMVDVGNLAMMIWNRQNPYGYRHKKKQGSQT